MAGSRTNMNSEGGGNGGNLHLQASNAEGTSYHDLGGDIIIEGGRSKAGDMISFLYPHRLCFIRNCNHGPIPIRFSGIGIMRGFGDDSLIHLTRMCFRQCSMRIVLRYSDWLMEEKEWIQFSLTGYIKGI